jgi:ABC-type sugar transport system permease subunit
VTGNTDRTNWGRLRLLHLRKSTRDNIAGYLFLTPALIGFLVFTVFPALAGLVMGFLEWDLLRPPTWVGIENFVQLTRDDIFITSLRNTLLWVLYYVPISIGLALVLALAMNMQLRGISIFRTVFYIPVVSPLLAVALLFVWLYNPEFGLINYGLSRIGIPPLQWLTSPMLALPSIALMAIWKNAGWNMLIYLAALNAIPSHLYEAATIDGANRWQIFQRITLPLLTPATFFIIITSLIAAFQVFGEIYIMTSGGPGYSTYTMTFYLWMSAFRYNKMGYAGAIGAVMFAIIVFVTFIQFRFFGRKVQYDL